MSRFSASLLTVTISLMLVTSSMLKAQSLLIPGAEWYYKMYNFSSPPQINTFNVDRDTIIDGKQYHVVEREHATCDFRPEIDFVREENDRLSFYNIDLQREQVLYDYTATAGDTLTIQHWSMYPLPDTQVYMFVESTDSIELNGQIHKRLHVLADWFDMQEIVFESNDYFRDTIIQGLGSQANFFPNWETGFCDWRRNGGIRCFNSPDVDLRFTKDSCTQLISSVTDFETSAIHLFPNPVEDVLTVKGLPNDDVATFATVLDLTGRVLAETRFEAHVRVQIDLGDLHKGLYFLQLRDELGRWTERFSFVKD